MIKSLYDSVKVGMSLEPLVRTADDTTPLTGIDTAGYESGLVIVSAGAMTTGGGTPETYTFQLYECATEGGSYTAVSGASVALTAANTVGLLRVDNLLALQRYLKVQLDVAGDSPSAACSAHILLSNGKSGPVNA